MVEKFFNMCRVLFSFCEPHFSIYSKILCSLRYIFFVNCSHILPSTLDPVEYLSAIYHSYKQHFRLSLQSSIFNANVLYFSQSSNFLFRAVFSKLQPIHFVFLNSYQIHRNLLSYRTFPSINSQSYIAFSGWYESVPSCLYKYTLKFLSPALMVNVQKKLWSISFTIATVRRDRGNNVFFIRY